jgi:hypothetical protein
MRIITVNLPVSYLKMIDGLVGENALYPSRSELIRVAVKEFLVHELEAVETFSNSQKSITQTPEIVVPPTVDPNLFVQVPVGSTSSGSPEYKTFRLVKK